MSQLISDAVRNTRSMLEAIGPALAKLDDIEGRLANAQKELEETHRQIIEQQTEWTLHPFHKAKQKLDQTLAELTEVESELAAKRIELVTLDSAVNAKRNEHERISDSLDALRKRLG